MGLKHSFLDPLHGDLRPASLDLCEGNVPKATGTEKPERDESPGARCTFPGGNAGVFVVDLLRQVVVTA